MAKKDLSFVIGIIKSREKYLVGEEKIARLLEADGLSHAIKQLKEYGFGKETDYGEDYERLLCDEEEKTLAFFRAYYEGEAYFYLCAGNDFHNAECAVRERFLSLPAQYKTNGAVEKDRLIAAVESGNYKEIPSYLADPMRRASALFEEGKASGAAIGMIFLSAYYAYAQKIAKSGALKDALRYEIDAKNVATVLRSGNFAVAKPMLLAGGRISTARLALLVENPAKAADEASSFGEYRDLVLLGLRAAETRSFVEFERFADSFSMKKMKERRFETEGTFPLLLYAFYKKAELSNVRVLLVGKRGGVKNEQIKARLKEGYAG